MYDWHDFATALRLFIMLANIFNAVDPKPDPTYGSKLLTLPDPTQRLSLVQRYSLDLKIFFVFEMIFWFFFYCIDFFFVRSTSCFKHTFLN